MTDELRNPQAIESRSWRRLTVASILLGLALAPVRGAAPAGTPATGVWGFVSETDTEKGVLIRDDRTWSGIWAFTSRYHALARMEQHRKSLSSGDLAKLPPEEQVTYYEQLMHVSSTAGTYEIAGQTLRRQWLISLNPDIIGQESVGTYSVDGDRLTVDLPRRSADSGPATRVVYRRLENSAVGRPTPVTGVWSFVSETDAEAGKLLRDEKAIEAIWIFTNQYYVVARMETNRHGLSKAALAALPPGEQVKYYQQLRRYASTAGEYSVDGQTLRRKWQISNGPDLIGQESVGKYSVQGDRLLVELPRRSGAGGPTHLVYRRLE